MTTPTVTAHPPWCVEHLDCTGTCVTTIHTAADVLVYGMADPGSPPQVHVGGHATDLDGLDHLIATLTHLRDDLTTRSPR